MPYKEYKPDSTDKVVIDGIDIEVHKFTDRDNVYWCGECGEFCPPEFFYINDNALCSTKCKDAYLEKIRESQESDEVKAMQKDLDKQMKAEAKKQAKAQAQYAKTQAKAAKAQAKAAKKSKP